MLLLFVHRAVKKEFNQQDKISAMFKKFEIARNVSFLLLYFLRILVKLNDFFIQINHGDLFQGKLPISRLKSLDYNLLYNEININIIIVPFDLLHRIPRNRLK